MAPAERTVRSQRPGASTRILWDTRLQGLGCRITPAGSRVFVLRYKDAKGKQRLATVARVGEVSLKEIRELAGGELLKIRMGETDLLRRRQKRRKSVTVAQGIRTFFDEFCPNRVQNGRMTPRTGPGVRETGGTLPDSRGRQAGHRRGTALPHRKHGKPATPVLRNRVLALASRVFLYFEDWGLRQQYSNPCRGGAQP